MKIIIDSKNRDKSFYPNSNNFRYNLKGSYTLSKVRLTSAQILTSDYIINSNNNLFHITLSGNSHINTLSLGTWSASTYATQLQTDLNTSGNWDTDPLLTFTVTYNSNNNKLTITSSSSIIINFNLSSKLSTKLGFSDIATTNATTHTSDKVVQMYNSRYYNIIIPQLQREDSEGLDNKAFARIYNTVNPNELLNYNEYYYKNIEHKFNKELTPRSLDISIQDENNDLVTFNSDFILEIYFQ